MASTPAAPETKRRTKDGLQEDRFDRIVRSDRRGRNGRVGAHRVTIRPRHVWQYLIGALLGFALLTTIGIVVVQTLGNGESLPIIGENSGSTGAQHPAKANLDPAATITVLNGTPTKNLAAALEKIITDKQWGQVLYASSTEKSDVKISAVFYRDSKDAAAAAGLAAKLGGLSTYATENYQEYDTRLIVLIGEDYVGPGLDEAKAMPQPSEAPETSEPDTDPDTDPDAEPETEPEIDPDTGWSVDPATGWLIDPATGKPVDPNASEPAQ